MTKLFSQKGAGVVEAVVGLAIFAFFLTTIIGSFVLFMRANIDNTGKIQASFLLEEGLEALRWTRDNDWTSFNDLTPPTNTASIKTYVVDANPGGITVLEQSGNNAEITLDNITFVRTFAIHDICRHLGTKEALDLVAPCSAPQEEDSETKRVIMTVEWQNAAGTEDYSKTLEAYLANIF